MAEKASMDEITPLLDEMDIKTEVEDLLRTLVKVAAAQVIHSSKLVIINEVEVTNAK